LFVGRTNTAADATRIIFPTTFFASQFPTFTKLRVRRIRMTAASTAEQLTDGGWVVYFDPLVDGKPIPVASVPLDGSISLDFTDFPEAGLKRITFGTQTREGDLMLQYYNSGGLRDHCMVAMDLELVEDKP